MILRVENISKSFARKRAYYPSQSAIIAVFTDHPVSNSVVLSLAYGSFFLILSMVIFYNKMRIKK